MLSKSEKIWIKSLKEKKTRNLRNEFIAEGSRLVLDMIKATPEKLKLLCATPEWHAKFEPILATSFKEVRIISKDILQSISSLKTTEEVLAIFSFPEKQNANYVANKLIIYLDNIRDPGNLGTIIRSADWFGISQLFCAPGCADPFNNKCVQATMSSIMRVQVFLKTWDEMLESYKAMDKFAASSDGLSIYDFKKESINFICIGNEANGISPEILRHCKHSVSIPSTHSLGAESLNAAVACSLIMGWKTYGGSNEI